MGGHSNQIRRAAAAEPAVADLAPAPGGLVVGAVDDPAEREADDVAHLIVQALASPGPPTADGATIGHSGSSSRVRRSSSVRRSSLTTRSSQRSAAGGAGGRASTDISRRVQRSAVGAEGGPIDADTSRRVQAAAGGAPMPGRVQRSMEQAFGADFSDVRVHAGAESRDLNDRLQASAFTAQSHIWFRDGVPDTSSSSGQHLMAHELAHVVQQRGGGGDPQRMVRRRFLDDEDWVANTKNTGFFGGNRRSTEMKVIDAAVQLWDTAYFAGSVGGMIVASKAILDAVAVWEGSKKDASKEMRYAEVTELKNEARAWNTKTTQWFTAFPARRAQHMADRALLDQWIDEGLNQDTDERLRNACQWVRSNKMRLYLVSETPDSLDRGAMLLGKELADVDPDTLCYFPDATKPVGDLLSAPAFYNFDDLTDTANVDVDEEGRGTKGWNQAGKCIVITEEGMRDGRAEVWGTLKHEVQHDADKHQGEELSAGVAAAVGNEAVASAEALQGYKTEYRAHFYQGDPTFDGVGHDDGDRITKKGLSWTRRQYVIFKKIYDNYGYVEDAWGDTTGADPVTPTQLAFRSAVAAYWNPDSEGFNKYDSIRVDDLYNALHQVPVGTTDAAAPGMDALLKAARMLEPSDVRYVRDQNESVMLSAKISRHLAGAALAAFQDALDDSLVGAVADWLESIFG